MGRTRDLGEGAVHLLPDQRWDAGHCNAVEKADEKVVVADLTGF